MPVMGAVFVSGGPMRIDLSGKRAVVTGSTEGIGLAVAGGLAAAGADVVINGRSSESVEAAITQITAAVPEARLSGIAGDLASPEGCARFLAALPETDILVNNVGIFEPKPFFEIEDADWTRFFETNVMAGVRLSRVYIKPMLKKGWGRIVFIASESAINVPTEMIHYGVTKTALLSLSRGLAKLAQGTEVTVNAVLPGPTLTTGVEAMLRGQAEQEGKTIEEVATQFVRTKRPSSIIGRMAEPREVASLVVYTCSEQASATTGAALRVDGGVIESIY